MYTEDDTYLALKRIPFLDKKRNLSARHLIECSARVFARNEILGEEAARRKKSWWYRICNKTKVEQEEDAIRDSIEALCKAEFTDQNDGWTFYEYFDEEVNQYRTQLSQEYEFTKEEKHVTWWTFGIALFLVIPIIVFSQMTMTYFGVNFIIRMMLSISSGLIFGKIIAKINEYRLKKVKAKYGQTDL